MNGKLFNQVPMWLYVALGLGLSLFGANFTFSSNGFFSHFSQEIVGFIRDPQTQWLILLCLCFYFTTLMLLQPRQQKASFWRLNTRELLMIAVFVVAAFSYVVDYPVSTQSIQPLVLFASATLGKGAGVLAAFKRRKLEGENRNNPEHCRNNLAVLVELILVILLTLASIWETNAGRGFGYDGNARCSGPWDNPNIFGLLMGTGIALVVGLLFQSLISKTKKQKVEVGKYTAVILYLLAGILMARGLLHSYSRGAWLATGFGVTYLFIWSTVRSPQSMFSGHSCVSWLKNNWFPLSAILFSVVALCIWHFRQTDWLPARRALSAINAVDFSWRNRVLAWMGDLQIMAEHPWLGAGWNQPDPMYEHYYLPPKLTESAAIQMNDYLMLGATLGIPALFCFGMYLWLSLTKKAEIGNRKSETKHLIRPSGTFSPSDAEKGSLDWMQTICCAGAIVLLVGFWFDGGLFKLPTAATFWILLELGSVSNREWTPINTMIEPQKGTSDTSSGLRAPFPLPVRRRKFFCALCAFLRPCTGFVPVLVLLLFVGVLFWAKAQDPFSRKWFAVKAADGGTVKCVAVLPKPIRPRPVVIYAHGSGGKLMNDGFELRQMAEMGMATVSLEYNQSNGVVFNDQFNALLQYISRQKWADTNAFAWVGFSLGANRMLDFALQYPGQQPQLMVQLGGAGLPDAARSQKSEVSLKCPVLLIHGEQDEIFPVADTKRLAVVLQSNGVPVKLKIISSMGHSTGADGGSVFRGIGEYCMTHFSGEQALQNYHSIAQWQAEAPPLWPFLLPAVAWAAGWLVWWMFGRCNSAALPRRPLTRSEIALRWLAALLATWALVETALHLVPPCLPVSERTLDIARRFLILPKENSDFQFLAAQPIWHGQKLKTLLTHVELACYNRELINWQLDDTIYRDFVLSPVITGDAGEQLNWRRPLWEEFYPRVRRESSPEDAAKIVVRHLRERVTIIGGLSRGETPDGTRPAMRASQARATPGQPAGEDARATTADLPHEVPDIWRRQITDEVGFEIVYVAALRSVGVPARLSQKQKAEYFTGATWEQTPRPVLFIAGN